MGRCKLGGGGASTGVVDARADYYNTQSLVPAAEQWVRAADYIANNQLDLAYDQGAMPAFRRRMAARIIAGTLDAEEARQPGAPLRSECL